MFSIFTLCLSYVVSAGCFPYSPSIVAEAGFLTLGSVGTITFYVWKNRDKDFTFLWPMLSVGLWVLLFGSLLRIFFPSFGTFGDLCWSILGCIVFTGLLTMDIYLTLEIYEVDEYVLAALSIYVDIINLFFYILQCIGGNNR